MMSKSDGGFANENVVQKLHKTKKLLIDDGVLADSHREDQKGAVQLIHIAKKGSPKSGDPFC
jgi:hypothetical protein